MPPESTEKLPEQESNIGKHEIVKAKQKRNQKRKVPPKISKKQQIHIEEGQEMKIPSKVGRPRKKKEKLPSKQPEVQLKLQDEQQESLMKEEQPQKDDQKTPEAQQNQLERGEMPAQIDGRRRSLRQRSSSLKALYTVDDWSEAKDSKARKAKTRGKRKTDEDQNKSQDDPSISKRKKAKGSNASATNESLDEQKDEMPGNDQTEVAQTKTDDQKENEDKEIRKVEKIQNAPQEDESSKGPKVEILKNPTIDEKTPSESRNDEQKASLDDEIPTTRDAIDSVNASEQREETVFENIKTNDFEGNESPSARKAEQTSNDSEESEEKILESLETTPAKRKTADQNDSLDDVPLSARKKLKISETAAQDASEKKLSENIQTTETKHDLIEAKAGGESTNDKLDDSLKETPIKNDGNMKLFKETVDSLMISRKRSRTKFQQKLREELEGMELECKTPRMSPATSPPMASSTRIHRHWCGEESEDSEGGDDTSVDLFQKIKDYEKIHELKWDDDDNDSEKENTEAPSDTNKADSSAMSKKPEQSPNSEVDEHENAGPFTNKLVDSIQVARKRGSKRALSTAEDLFEQQKLAARKRLKLDEDESPTTKDAPVHIDQKDVKPQEKTSEVFEKAIAIAATKENVKKSKDTPSRSINIRKRTLNFEERDSVTAEAEDGIGEATEKKSADDKEVRDDKESDRSAVESKDAPRNIDEKEGSEDPSEKTDRKLDSPKTASDSERALSAKRRIPIIGEEHKEGGEVTVREQIFALKYDVRE
eukprot:TRINITY_DN2954_c0_g1_i9.p1 TRINITY_DN2954_c0_g1~~TRINITY_DN2954_c0_g1_i9.p1  ORF type:complete len:827 (-),score=258.20 TRINITY_DN2954_c0_g1_i9:319-2622(-)